MMKHDHARLSEQLLPAVLAAGAAIMRHRSQGFAVQAKADRSPVTAADNEAEEIILAALAICAPGIPVIAEEATSRGEGRRIAEDFFLVDPLDGTREFVAGGTDFTVNIGLISDRIPRFGVIYAPATGDLYMTLGPHRAVEARVSHGSAPSRLADIPLAEMHTREPDPERLIAVASRSHRTPDNERFVADPRVAGCRNIGSSLKFCLVARGEADIYPRFGETSEWDTAAGHAITIAAGGEVTTTAGEPFLYGKSGQGFRNPPFIAWGRRSLMRVFKP